MKRWIIWIIVVDLMWIVVAFATSVFLRYGVNWNQEWNAVRVLAPFAAGTCVLWLLLSLATKLDGFRGGWHFPAVASRIVIAVSLLMAAVLACGYAFHDFVSRLALAYFGLLLLVGFVLIRYSTRAWLQSQYGRKYVSNVVIIGWGRIAQELARKVSRHPEMLCRVVGFLCPREFMRDDEHECSDASAGRSTVPSVNVLDFLRQKHVHRVVLALSRPAWPEVLKMADQCREEGIAVSIIPHPYELYLSKPEFTDLDGLPLIQLQTEARAEAPVLKRALDVCVGSMLLCVTAPVVLAAAAFLRVKTGRSFRVESRCGQYGKTFDMWRLNIDRHTVRAGSVEQALDRVGIVELPQLWNVLRGEMSLVGPRPESPDRVRCYSEWQQQRLYVKPGITGLAQVHGLREHSSSEEKARFDLQYRVNQSLFLDLSLLLQTLWTVSVRLISQNKDGIEPTNGPLMMETQGPPFTVGEVLYSVDSTQSSAD